MFAPDTQQNIIYTAYFILLHNFEAILYTIGIVIMTMLTLYRPTRGKILIMWGFIVLLFAFEYEKHILEPLRQQTIESLITERESWRIEHTINLVLARIAPKALPLLGWILIVTGIFFDKIYHYIRHTILSSHKSAS